MTSPFHSQPPELPVHARVIGKAGTIHKRASVLEADFWTGNIFRIAPLFVRNPAGRPLTFLFHLREL
jgi:hypothetical protein